MLRNTFGKYLEGMIYSKHSKAIYFEAFTWQFQNRMSYSDVHAKPELIKPTYFKTGMEPTILIISVELELNP